MDLSNISSDNKTITNKTSNLITNSAIVSNDITNPELSTPKISYTPRILYAQELGFCTNIKNLTHKLSNPPSLPSLIQDNIKSLGFSATCSKCVDLKLKSMNNLTTHGRNNKFVVPFHTYLAFLLSFCPWNESYHVLLQSHLSHTSELPPRELTHQTRVPMA